MRGIIFDVDGTLVNSNDLHARAWVDTFVEAGYSVEFPDVRPLIGMGGDKLIPAIAGPSVDADLEKQLGERRSEIFQSEYLPFVQPFPDVRSLAEHMHAQGLRLFAATSAKEAELEILLDIAGIDDLITKTASKQQADRSKPDPDVLHAAVNGSGLSASDLLMIGDTPYDIEAAQRAGIRTVAFRSGGWDDETLAGASAIYDGTWDLYANYSDFERTFVKS